MQKVYRKVKVSLTFLTPMKVHPLKMAKTGGKNSKLSTAHNSVRYTIRSKKNVS